MCVRMQRCTCSWLIGVSNEIMYDTCKYSASKAPRPPCNDLCTLCVVSL